MVLPAEQTGGCGNYHHDIWDYIVAGGQRSRIVNSRSMFRSRSSNNNSIITTTIITTMNRFSIPEFVPPPVILSHLSYSKHVQTATVSIRLLFRCRNGICKNPSQTIITWVRTASQSSCQPWNESCNTNSPSTIVVTIVRKYLHTCACATYTSCGYYSRVG